MNKKFLILGILVVLILAGAGSYWGIQRSSQKPIVRPRIGPIVEAIYGLGTVTATHTFNLKLGVTDVVDKLYVHEGQAVKKGQLLISFDQNSSVPQKAPFDGVVTAVHFKDGEMVFPQATIMTVVDLSDRYISLSLEQTAAMRVRAGQIATMTFESLANERFQGTVRSVYPQDSQFVAQIEIEQLPAQILPGMTADVALEVGRKDEALLIPVTALAKGKLQLRRAGKKMTLEVKLGIIDGEWAEVLSNNVQKEDELVINGGR